VARLGRHGRRRERGFRECESGLWGGDSRQLALGTNPPLAQECRVLARTLSTDEGRAQLMAMSDVWERLADQQEQGSDFTGVSPPAAEQSAIQQQQQMQPKDDDEE